MEAKNKLLDELYHSKDGYLGFNPFWKLVKEKKEENGTYKNITYGDVQKYYKSIPEVHRFTTPTEPNNFSHIIAIKPNQIHQIDLIEMDRDNGYKYILSVVDVFTRYASGTALKNKKQETLTKALKEAYDNTPLDFPERIMCDQGKEFDNELFRDMLTEHNTRLLVNPTLNKRYTSIVERFNQSIERPIFLRQGRKELAEAPESQADVYDFYPKWIEWLKEVIDAYNKRGHTLLDGKSPEYAMKHPENIVYKLTPADYLKNPPKLLPLFTPVKIVQNGGRKSIKNRFMRETFSNKIYYIRRIKLDDMVNPVRYYLIDAEENILPVSFYREDLLTINPEKVAQPEKRKERAQVEEEEEEEERDMQNILEAAEKPTEKVAENAAEKPRKKTTRKPHPGKDITQPSRRKTRLPKNLNEYVVY